MYAFHFQYREAILGVLCNLSAVEVTKFFPRDLFRTLFKPRLLKRILKTKGFKHASDLRNVPTLQKVFRNFTYAQVYLRFFFFFYLVSSSSYPPRLPTYYRHHNHHPLLRVDSGCGSRTATKQSSTLASSTRPCY